MSTPIENNGLRSLRAQASVAARLVVPATAVVALLALHRAPRADAPEGRYVDTVCDGTACVNDVKTGLYWKKTEEPGTHGWSAAKDQCKTPWRLPNVRELQSLLDETRTAGPAIDVRFFPGASNAWLWSSTPYAPAPGSAWGLTFQFGNTFFEATTSLGHVRCVR